MLSQDEAGALLLAHDLADCPGEVARAVGAGSDRATTLEELFDRYMDECRAARDVDDVDVWTRLQEQGVEAEHLHAWLEQLWDDCAQEVD